MCRNKNQKKKKKQWNSCPLILFILKKKKHPKDIVCPVGVSGNTIPKKKTYDFFFVVPLLMAKNQTL